MAIKDKDGNVFKLKGPNPLMKTQEPWDKKYIKLINFDKISNLIEMIDLKNPIREMEEKIPDISKLMQQTKILEKEKEDFENLTATPPSPIVVEVIKDESEVLKTPEIEESIPTMHTTLFSKLYEQKKIDFLAVDVKEKVFTDKLYGDTYSKTEFSNKIEFSGVITEETDFEMEFWTQTKINIKSILYPKNKQKRWWQVRQTQEKTGGFLVSCVLSVLNPSFD